MCLTLICVRLIGLEPTRRKTLDPKSSASTNSATGAFASAKVIKLLQMAKSYGRIYCFASIFLSL